MTNVARNNLRQVWRALTPLVLIAGSAAVITAGEWLFLQSLWWAYGALPDKYTSPRLYPVLLVAGFAGWGWARAVILNPATSREYRHWLATTPWNAEKPLPFGRVELNAIDAVPLVVGALLCLWHALGWCVAAAYFGMYGLTLLGITARQGHYVVSAIGTLGFTLLPWAIILAANRESSWPIIACVAWAIPWAWAGWRQTVKSLARQDSSELASQLRDFGSHGVDRTNLRAEWPRVHPWSSLDLAEDFSPTAIATIVLLLAWVAGVATLTVATGIGFMPTGAEADSAAEFLRQMPGGLGIATAVLFAGWRLLRYLKRCRPPLWPWARLRTGRFVDHAFDRVFIAPLATLATGVATAYVTFLLGVPPIAASAINVATPVLAALSLRPTLAEWRLTGGYRMATGPSVTRSTPQQARRRTV